MTTIPRRFTENETELMREWSSKLGKSAVARKLGVKVTAVDNWARRNRVEFFGARKTYIPKPMDKREVKSNTNVDRLMDLVEKTGRRA